MFNSELDIWKDKWEDALFAEDLEHPILLPVFIFNLFWAWHLRPPSRGDKVPGASISKEGWNNAMNRVKEKEQFPLLGCFFICKWLQDILHIVNDSISSPL